MTNLRKYTCEMCIFFEAQKKGGFCMFKPPGVRGIPQTTPNRRCGYLMLENGERPMFSPGGGGGENDGEE